jgi:plasmid maintenance system killer protein
MIYRAANKKLAAALASASAATRQYGPDMAKKLLLRRHAVVAAKTLADFWPPKSGPERCHELSGDLAGIFSMDLKQPYRLLFTAPESVWQEDQLTRWRTIELIEFVRVEDTHG